MIYVLMLDPVLAVAGSDQEFDFQSFSILKSYPDFRFDYLLLFKFVLA